MDSFFVDGGAPTFEPKAGAAFAAITTPMASRRVICWVEGCAEGFDGSTLSSMRVSRQEQFAGDRSVSVGDPSGIAVARIASAIGEPARACILYHLVDGRARTSTELAMVANVSPSTASAHLNRLKTERLVKVLAQGKYRYYSLEGPTVASALEGLSVLAGVSGSGFVSSAPIRLRTARTCYDHVAGALGVALHDRFQALGWLSADLTDRENTYDLTLDGTKACEALGIDIAATRTLRRRFAFACLDWSERRPHIGGALGAALLKTMLKRKWLTEDLDSRALAVTSLGRREMQARFGIKA